MSQRQANHPEGYEAPVHLSLVEPVLVAGLPRTVGFIYWTSVAALTIGMHQLWILPVAMLGHWGCAAGTQVSSIGRAAVFVAKLTGRWWQTHRSRLSEAGSKPPQAADVKRIGRERWGNVSRTANR